MTFFHIKNLQEAIDGMKKVFSISMSLNFKKIAVAHIDDKRTVRISLFDEEGNKKDSFPTRPSNKNNKSYVVRDIIFSNDGSRIAISQSDSIIFIYNIGNEWGDKKNICNKFEQTSQVSCLIWPKERQNEVFFGVSEGKVKVGNLKTNLSQVLYSTDSYIVSLDVVFEEEALIFSGHIDNSIYKFSLEKNQLIKVYAFTGGIPYCISYVKNALFIAGNNLKALFISYDTGNIIKEYDYSKSQSDSSTTSLSYKDFLCCKSSLSKRRLAVGNYNRFIIYEYSENNDKFEWDELDNVYIPNFYTITAIEWKADESQVLIGSLCGSVDIYEGVIDTQVYNEDYIITVISNYHINIKNNKLPLANNSLSIYNQYNSSIHLPFKYDQILKFQIYENRYCIVSSNHHTVIKIFETNSVVHLNFEFEGNEKIKFWKKDSKKSESGGLFVYKNNSLLGFNILNGKCVYQKLNVLFENLEESIKIAIGEIDNENS